MYNFNSVTINLFDTLFLSIVNVIFLLIAIAYFTLSERKIMAAMQRRSGPNVVGFYGLLQPLADGLKLLFKEIIIPKLSDKYLFILAPCISFVLSMLSWVAVPFNGYPIVDLSFGALFVYAVTSLEVYGIILAGWSSNSKYAFLGSMRSAAQMISYEVSMGFVVLTIGLVTGTYNFISIVNCQKDVWFFLPLLPLFFIYLISGLAETNRAPFDLPEAEAEIVAGYNVEYSGILFAMFFLAEYSNMLLFGALSTIYFLGGWYSPITGFFEFDEFWFSLKLVFVSFFYVWVRATFPRFRYDQLLLMGWKYFLPITFSYFLFVAGILFFFDGLPLSYESIISNTNKEYIASWEILWDDAWNWKIYHI
jgi:NADH-quinone oxidoreductase subunit H